MLLIVLAALSLICKYYPPVNVLEDGIGTCLPHNVKVKKIIKNYFFLCGGWGVNLNFNNFFLKKKKLGCDFNC